MGERIQKYLASIGVASRRTVEQWILQQRVTVNGDIALVGRQVSARDEIRIDGKIVKKDSGLVYFLLNKPKGTLSSVSDDRGRKTVVDLIDTKTRIYPVGRLDFDTTGVLLLTNDGDLTNKLIHPKFALRRVYRASIDQVLTDEEIDFLNGDQVLIDELPSKQIVKQVGAKNYQITLHEGKNHHVKKIFETVNAKVISLKRIAFGPLNVHGLEIGNYRKLTAQEIKLIKTEKSTI